MIPQRFDGDEEIQINNGDLEETVTPHRREDAGPSSSLLGSWIPSAEERGAIIASHNALEAEQDKENNPALADSQIQAGKRRLIDRQPDAVRVEFEGTQPPGNDDNPQATPLRNDNMPEPSEDDEFQHDTRDLLPINRNRKRPAAERTNSQRNKRVRVARTVGTPPIDPTSSPVEDDDTIFNRVSKKAKLLTIQKNLAKQPQARKPWSILETNTLEELIEEYGTSWTLLKQNDVEDVLADRDQVALKDKARNMKFNYMKLGSPVTATYYNADL